MKPIAAFDWKLFVSELAPLIREHVAREIANAKLSTIISAPLANGAALGSYQPGTLVTHAGSMWHCYVDSRSRPGESPDWTLAVKRGSDGKDAALAKASAR